MSILGRSLLGRVGKGIPVGRLLLAGDVALLAGRHIGRLDGAERRRLLVLLRESARRRGSLDPTEREELATLVAKMEPRLLFGTAVRRLSPVPLPGRVLYGRGGGRSRAAREPR
jgi:hypothetical protein